MLGMDFLSALHIYVGVRLQPIKKYRFLSIVPLSTSKKRQQPGPEPFLELGTHTDCWCGALLEVWLVGLLHSWLTDAVVLVWSDR